MRGREIELKQKQTWKQVGGDNEYDNNEFTEKEFKEALGFLENGKSPVIDEIKSNMLMIELRNSCHNTHAKALELCVKTIKVYYYYV